MRAAANASGVKLTERNRSKKTTFTFSDAAHRGKGKWPRKEIKIAKVRRKLECRKRKPQTKNERPSSRGSQKASERVL